MAAIDLTAQRLREVLDYCPETGVFTWRIARRKCTVGAIAGSVQKRGYVTVKVDYFRHYAHRLAWLYMTDHWPVNQIDHRNLDKSDNRWTNLRAATQKQNAENMPIRRTSTTGIAGVTWNQKERKWVASIKHYYRKITLGYFVRIEDATACRRAAESMYFTHSRASELQDGGP